MKIFLDLDGTILDAKYRYYKIYTDMLSQTSFNMLDISTYWDMKRNRIPEEEIASKTTSLLFAKYYAKKRIDLIESMDYLILDVVFDGVYDVLNKWSFDHDLYLVTLRRNKTNLYRQLSFFDLHKYFRCVYNAGEFQIKKENLIKHEILDQSKCAIIGDTEVDIEAGKVLSIKTIAVTSGIRNKYLLEREFPDVLVDSLCDNNLCL